MTMWGPKRHSYRDSAHRFYKSCKKGNTFNKNVSKRQTFNTITNPYRDLAHRFHKHLSFFQQSLKKKKKAYRELQPSFWLWGSELLVGQRWLESAPMFVVKLVGQRQCLGFDWSRVTVEVFIVDFESVGQRRCLGVTALGFQFEGHFVTVEVFSVDFG